MGVAVPTIHYCAGNESDCVDLFSSHTVAVIRKLVVGAKSFTITKPLGKAFSARTPVVVRVSVKMPSPCTALPPRMASVGEGVSRFNVATVVDCALLLRHEGTVSGKLTSSTNFKPP